MPIAEHADSKPCPRGTLVGSTGPVVALYPARCKRWACEHCGRKKARVLAQRITASPARRFLTLTARPSAELTPEAQLDLMNRGWRLLWKRLKRRFPTHCRGYVRIVELHRSGSPHLHLALDTEFIPQRLLSQWWEEITGSPIVDIRVIRSERGMARYLAKYLTKAHETLQRRRKWSQSNGFLPPVVAPTLGDDELPLGWRYWRSDPDRVRLLYLEDGWGESGPYLVAPWAALVSTAPP